MNEPDSSQGSPAVVVGVDGSPGAAEALRWALAEARLRKAPLRIVHAWTLGYETVTGGSGAIRWYGSESLGVDVTNLARAAQAVLEQATDPIIEDVEVTLDALREELHLFASREGSMVGPITITDSGDTIDLRRMGSGGWAVPSIVEENVITFRKHEAKYVLLIEKDAVWTRFNEDKFWKRNNCIIVQGGGQPPRGVRRLVQRLHKELKLPVYVLVDNDPWGFYIYSVMKQGSINLAYESMRMAVPDARFIGLSSFDKEKYKLPGNVAIKMDDGDNNRAKQMLAYPWFKHARWQREIQEMIKSGLKFEIQALSRHGISFITEEYLPKKLKDRDWLE